VGVVETTSQPQEFVHRGSIFTDLPGCGTRNWPRESYIEKLKLLTYDCFLLITAHRFTENDVFLYQELSARGKPCFVIRNMFDRAVDDARHDNQQSELESRQLITANIQKNLEPACPDRIYLTSARDPTRYDLKDLLNDISDALPGLKRTRFIADMASYGEEALKKKREVAKTILPWYAGLSAANGLNPIPGTDIAVDVGILLKLALQIAEIYGLTSNQFEYIKRLLGPRAVPALLAKIAQFTTKYLAQEGITVVLRQIAKRATAKAVAKWIPLVGPFVAAGLGWCTTFMFGDQLIDEAEALAREILNGIIAASDPR